MATEHGERWQGTRSEALLLKNPKLCVCSLLSPCESKMHLRERGSLVSMANGLNLAANRKAKFIPI